MTRNRGAILAGWIVALAVMAALGAAPPPETAPPAAPDAEQIQTTPSTRPSLPIRASFRLADGVRVTGQLEAWDDQGIDGSFGRRRWSDLAVDDVWTLLIRLIDDAAAADWIAVGSIMARLDDGDLWAERAFRRALRQDESALPQVEAARAEIAAWRQRLRQERRQAEAERLTTLTPEARRWPTDPWPPLTDDQQLAAARAVRAEARQIVREAGQSLEPAEVDHFIVYGDGPRRQVARWALQLDAAYRTLAEILGRPEGENLLWGRAVVFLWSQRDEFRLVDAQAFGHLVSSSDRAICHYRGPQVLINAVHDEGDPYFGVALIREAAHGILHRYRTPRRLPAWANEGLALYLADRMLEGSPVDQALRRQARDFVRAGGNVDALLDLGYRDPAWPGPQDLAPAVGYLLVDFMLRHSPESFAAWVGAVKDGRTWEQALTEHYRLSRRQLVSLFVRYYQVNE